MYKICRWMSVAALTLLASVAVHSKHARADSYPVKTVSIICDAAPGSAPDVIARFVAEGLSKIWEQQVIVINRPGANGSVAARAASQAVPDGYTLYMPAISTFLAPTTVAPNLPVRVPHDFEPIGYTAEDPMLFAVSPSLGVSTLPQLIALAKEKGSNISIAVTGVGRLTDLTGLLFAKDANVKLLRVPYIGGPAVALSDVGAGRVSMIIEGYSGIVGAVKAGQVKLIAVASRQRLPQFSNLPTVAETIPGFSATGWSVLLAPLHTPEPIATKVSADLAKVVTDASFQKQLAKIGYYSRAMTPKQVVVFLHEQQDTWLPLLQNVKER